MLMRIGHKYKMTVAWNLLKQNKFNLIIYAYN